MDDLNKLIGKHFTLACFATLFGLTIFLSLSKAESKYEIYDKANQESLGYVAE